MEKTGRPHVARLKITGDNWGEVFGVPGVTRVVKAVNELGDYAYLNGAEGEKFAYVGDTLVWAAGTEERASVERGEENKLAWEQLRKKTANVEREAAKEREKLREQQKETEE